MKKLEDINILVVGDIMLDKYTVGDVDRLSPEAPVPIVHVKKEYETLGGCGNVVRNLRELNVNVDCLASVGPDINAEIISRKLKDINVGNMLICASEETIVKERIIANGRKVQMLRIDREQIIDIDPKLAIDVFIRMHDDNKKYDMIVISDYNKGMITYNLMDFIKHLGITFIVDPKPDNFYMYNKAFMITPNKKEWDEVNKKISTGTPMYMTIEADNILVTKGKDGMTLLGDDESYHIEGRPVEIFNVSGAGDTVISILAVCLSAGMNKLFAAQIANECAAYVVTKPGTSIIPFDRFQKIVHSYTFGE